MRRRYIPRPDKILVQTGNIKIFEEQEDLLLEDVPCPICKETMVFEERETQLSQGPISSAYTFMCGRDSLMFVSKLYEGIEEFHNRIKDKVVKNVAV